MTFYDAFSSAIQILCKEGFKKKVITFLLLSLLMAFFEYLSIGIFIPFLNFVLDSSKINMLFQNNQFLNLIDKSQFFVLCIIIILLIFLLRFLFSLYFINFRNKFIYKINLKLSHTLFKKYLNSSYSYHLKKNSSELINMMNEISGFSSSTLVHMSNLFTDTIITFAIIILLLQFQPYGTISMFLILASFSLVFYFFYKKKSKEIGRNRVLYSEKRLRYMKESFSSIKEIFIYGLEDLFIKKLNNVNDIFFSLSAKERKIELIPRIYLEYLILFFFVIMTLVLKINNFSNKEIIFNVGIFALAGFKLMPCANRILNASQMLRAKIYSISKISKELNLINHEKSDIKFKNLKKNAGVNESKLNFDKKVNFENVNFKYKGSNSFIFKDLSIDIPKNKIIGIIGKSGVGKSTFVDLFTGLLKPTSGHIKIDDIYLENSDLRLWLNQISYVPQKAYLLDDTIKNNIYLENDSDKQYSTDYHLIEIIKKLHLEDYVNQLPEKLNTRIGEDGVQLSGGQRQRIILARALYKNSNIIILDEATSSLDIYTEREILKDLFQLQNKTIIIISHRPETLNNVDVLYQFEDQSVKRKK